MFSSVISLGNILPYRLQKYAPIHNVLHLRYLSLWLLRRFRMVVNISCYQHPRHPFAIASSTSLFPEPGQIAARCTCGWYRKYFYRFCLKPAFTILPPGNPLTISSGSIPTLPIPQDFPATPGSFNGSVSISSGNLLQGPP